MSIESDRRIAELEQRVAELERLIAVLSKRETLKLPKKVVSGFLATDG